MIEIKVTGSNVDIREDLSITFKWSNPMFTGINEGYSYSFSLPASAKNKSIIRSGLPIVISFRGIVVERGEIKSFRNTNSGFEINMQTEGKSFRKRMEELRLNEFEFDKFKICDESDSAPVKLSKWKSHMTSTASDATSGTHKFPPMQIFGTERYSTGPGEDFYNLVFDLMGGFVNPFFVGEYRSNFPVPVSFSASINFPFTIAPTPRIEYILNKVISNLGMRLINDLESILEFKQLIAFNNYVLDKIETLGSDRYNVHGTEIDLSKHVPDVAAWELFEFLIEFFDAFFVVSNNRIECRLFKNDLNSELVDYTKFTLDGFENETSEVIQPFILTYDIEKDEWKSGRFRKILSGSWPTGEAIFPYMPLSYPDEVDAASEVKLKHLPMSSQFIFSEGTSLNWSEFFNWYSSVISSQERFGYNENIAYLSPLNSAILKSDAYPENEGEIFQSFKIGFFRGIYETVKNNPDVPTDPSIWQHVFAYNFKDLMWYNEAFQPLTIPTTFGNTSAYISEDDNIFDTYLKPKLDFLSNCEIKKKQLFLPLHRLLELKQWKKINHFIQQRNESFRGTIQEVSFTLTNKGISPALISYYVQKSKKAEHSEDYNNDFTI